MYKNEKMSDSDLRKKLLLAEFSDGILEIAFGIGLLLTLPTYTPELGILTFPIIFAAISFGQFLRSKYTKSYIGYYKLNVPSRKIFAALLLLALPFLVIPMFVLWINFSGDARPGFAHPLSVSVFYLVGSIPLVAFAYGGLRYLYMQTLLKRLDFSSKIVGGVGLLTALYYAFSLRYNFGHIFISMFSAIIIVGGIIGLRKFIHSIRKDQ